MIVVIEPNKVDQWKRFQVPGTLSDIPLRGKVMHVLHRRPHESKAKHLKPIFYSHRKAFHYEPFKKITPGEAGVILDESMA